MANLMKYIVAFSIFSVAVFAVDSDTFCGIATDSVETIKHHLSNYENGPKHAVFDKVSVFFSTCNLISNSF